MFEGTGLLALGLDKDPKAALKNKIINFDEAIFQKAYTRAQGKYDYTLTIASRSHQKWSKLQSRTKTESPPGLNISPAKDP